MGTSAITDYTTSRTVITYIRYETAQTERSLSCVEYDAVLYTAYSTGTGASCLSF